MTQPHLFVDGKPLSVGRLIGKGGEGEVFLVADDTACAIKIYRQNAVVREPKIAAMIKKKLWQKTPLVAYPIAIARDPSGSFKGFVMPLVRDHKPLFNLYAPQARKQHFPGVDYRFLVRVALNTAKAIAAVHKSGCVIGDINHSGMLVSESATVALIDADSFQISDWRRRYLCGVGVREYTPPELQNVSLRNLVRTENHDAFGLAVALFLLLAMGRHPFAGTYANGDMPLPQAISEFRFAYSRRPLVDMTPPADACTLDDFPVPVAEAFEAVFGPEGSRCRPSAAQWVALLGELERSLRKCRKNQLHYYASAAPSCPWCRIEQDLQMILFLPKEMSIIPDADPDNFNLPTLWAQIEAIRAPSRDELLPAFSALAPAPSAEALASEKERLEPHAIQAADVIAGIIIFVVAPSWWLFALIVPLIAFLLAPEISDAFWCQRFLKVEKEWNRALDQWERDSGFSKVERLKASLIQSKRVYEALGPWDQRRAQALRQKLETEALQFGQAVHACRMMLKQPNSALEAIHAKRAQIEADLTHLGIKLPPRPARPGP